MICPDCRATVDEREVLITGTDYEQLRELLDGRFTTTPCPCGFEIGVPPVVRVDFAADSTPEVVRRELESRSLPVRAWERAADREAHLRRCWRELTPAALVAARLTGVSTGGLRADVWRALLHEWTEQFPPSLHDDLTRYVEPVGEMPEINGFLPYATEALRAAAGHASPAWADIYLQFELFAEREGTSARMLALRMPRSFVTATIDYPTAWAAVARLLDPVVVDDPLTSELVAQLVRVTTRAGYPMLVQAIRKERAAGRVGGPVDAASIVAAVLADCPGSDPEEALDRTRQYLVPIPRDQREPLIDELAAAYRQRFPDPDVRVWQAWRHLHDERMRAAELVLDSRPFPPVAALPPQIGARLLGARAALLSADGRVEPAIRWWREALTLVRDRPPLVTVRYWVQVQLALLLSDGAPDEAFELLNEAAYGPDGYGADPDILGRLAVLHYRRGDVDRALDLLTQAERYAAGNPVSARRYAAQRCQLLVAENRADEALEALVTARPSGPPDFATVLAESAAWAMLLTRDAVPAELAAAVRSLPDQLAALAGAAESARTEVALLARRAEFVQLTDPPAAGRMWEQLVRRQEHPEPEHLVQAARVRAQAGDLRGMRELLAATPDALARRYGTTADVDLLVREPGALMRPFADLARILIEAGTWADRRLVAELQRDAIGRAQRARYGGDPIPASPWLGEIDPVITAAGPVVVVEFARTGERTLTCFLTRITVDGSDSAPVPLADADPIQVERSLAARGEDPLSLPEWQELAKSMLTVLDERAQPGDHIVFLHEQAYSNLPWHTAIKDRWTVSYAAGWSHLAAVLHRGPSPRGTLGICLVPRDGEAPAVAAALRATRDRLTGPSTLTAEPAGTDRDFVARLLTETDTAVLLCHGYIDRRDRDSGIVIALGGRLPPHDSMSADLPAHRFGRRDVQRLTATSRTVFSAACSSGYAYAQGLGDRLGLGSALSRTGTTAFVAPMWEVEAADVLPVLERAVALHLAGTPLAQALRTAASEAADTGPDWMVWSLALEGNWQ